MMKKRSREFTHRLIRGGEGEIRSREVWIDSLAVQVKVLVQKRFNHKQASAKEPANKNKNVYLPLTHCFSTSTYYHSTLSLSPSRWICKV